jgi:hypothetical protein
MSNRFEPTGLARRLMTLLLASLTCVFAVAPVARAQNKNQAVVQIEVGDSIGLPLPDAKVEFFTFMEGGVFWEWIPVDSVALPFGINLLRFSHPGYRPSVFSVPIREKAILSLRVRLDPERDTTRAKESPEAQSVRAIALVIEGRAHTDVLGRRRVIAHESIADESVTRFGPLLRRARNTDLRVLPASGGIFRVFAQTPGGSYTCPVQVMVNGDRRRVLPFETFDQMYSVGDTEAIEIFPMANSVPLSYQLPRGGCGLLVVWFRTL